MATIRGFRASKFGAATMAVALLTMSGLVVAVSSTPAYAAPPIATINLGVASTFVVLGPAAVANTAGCCTKVRGDLGVGAALTGFGPSDGTYTGTLYSGPATGPAIAALQTAYDDAVSRTGGLTITPAAMTTPTFLPGVHKGAAAVTSGAGAVITLDAQDNPDAVFIFQINGALTLAANTTVVLANGAQARNVFWQTVGGFALGAGSTFVGTLLVHDEINIGAISVVNGRALALNGAIGMNNDQFYFPAADVYITSGLFAATSTPTITGTTTASAPDQVTITIQGQPGPFHVTPAGDHTWSLTTPLIADGTYTVVASFTDAAGNVGSATQDLTIDTVPPGVTINGDGSGTTISNDATPTISGTTQVAAGTTVTVTFARVSPATSLTRTTLVQADGTWNVTPSGLSAGTWLVTASVTDPAGNVGTASETLTLDLTAPPVTITGGATALTNDSTPALAGTTTDATVTLSIDGQDVAGIAQIGGNWSAPFPSGFAPLGNGAHHVAVTATDAAGNVSGASQTLTVDTTLPSIAIDHGAADATNDQTPTISGTTNVAVGVTVTVTVNGGSPMSALVQSGGTWNVTPSAMLDPGTYSVEASVPDPAGNVGTFIQSLTIDTTVPTVTIDGGPSRSTPDATPTISGSSLGVDVGSSITVTVDGQTLSPTIGGGGAWSVTATAISNGTHFVFVSVTDNAGNSGNDNQSLTINAVPPTVTILGGANASTNDSTPTISGSSNAVTGSPVVVSVASQTLNATVQPGGSWNVTAAVIANAIVTVTVSVTDDAGNVGGATQNLTVDSTSATTIDFTGGAARSTNDDTPTISGTTDAADGRIITITIAGQTMTSAAAFGTWSVTAAHLDDAIYTVNASASAVGGNPGSGSQSLTIDTVAPIVILPGGPSVDTTDPTPAITGSGATPGSTVTVTVAGQTMTTTVGADGTWSVTPPIPLPAGSHTVVVTITDQAGNHGTGSQVINVNTLPQTGASSPDFSSVGPKRVFDTRVGQSPNALRAVAKQQVSGSYELQVQMTDLAGFVPASGVGAVSLNVTSTGSTADGFITVFGCGTREVVSSVNFPAGRTVANAVVAPVSATGMVCFYANAPTDIIVDINGWFATGSAFTSVGPKRVVDTRPNNSPDALRAIAKAKIPANGMIEVRLSDLVGYVPASGVGAVSMNVVVTNPEASGFITAYSCGTRAVVSSVNFVAGQTVANAVIAPLSSSGTVCFYSLAATDLVVDINGWFAAGSGFNAFDPARVLDTRADNSPDALRDVPKVKIGGSNVLEVRVTDLAGRVPADGVTAVSLNVTVTNPDGDGFVTVFACGAMEEVSSLNYSVGATVANAVLAPVSATGTICLYSNGPTEVIVDINGWIGAAQAG